MANPSREIGPITYFYRAISFRLLLISAQLHPCPKTHHITPEKSRRTLVEHLLAAWYSMRLSQATLALSSLAVACEAFRFTVWLGDKCTISGTGTKPSDQELLVIPQTVDDDGCMV